MCRNSLSSLTDPVYTNKELKYYKILISSRWQRCCLSDRAIVRDRLREMHLAKFEVTYEQTMRIVQEAGLTRGLTRDTPRVPGVHEKRR